MATHVANPGASAVTFLAVAGICLALLLDASDLNAETPIADTLYQGGSILTLEEDGETVEALAIRNGRILAAGDKLTVGKYVGPDTQQVDLGGRTLMPAFVDGHGHFTFYAVLSDGLNVSSPPAGPMKNHEDIIAALTRRVKASMADFVAPA